MQLVKFKIENRIRKKSKTGKKEKKLTWTATHQVGPVIGPTPNTVSFLRNRGGGYRLPPLLCSLLDTPMVEPRRRGG
jgi:hypothetical protein